MLPKSGVQSEVYGASTHAVVARKQLFSSAHFYKQKRFSDAENAANFGCCFTPHGHGHNYVMEAFLEGPIEPVTGLVVNLAEVDELLKKITSVLDHQHLNFDLPEFEDTVPTTENIALYLRNKLLAELEQPKFKDIRLNRLRLFETDDLWVEVFG